MSKLPTVPMNISHQNYHRRHHQHRARVQVYLPSSHLLVHVPASMWCLVQNRSHGSLLQSPCPQLRGTLRCLFLRLPLFDFTAWARKTTACSIACTEHRFRNPIPCPPLFLLAWQLCFRIPTRGRRKLLHRPSSRTASWIRTSASSTRAFLQWASATLKAHVWCRSTCMPQFFEPTHFSSFVHHCHSVSPDPGRSRLSFSIEAGQQRSESVKPQDNTETLRHHVRLSPSDEGNRGLTLETMVCILLRPRCIFTHRKCRSPRSLS